jgi:molecular chaperone HtpG
MCPAPERHEFQAEVKQLLDLMVHSLYSNKDVALRELISNASDALDKLRYEQLTQPDLASATELHLRLEPDAKGRTLKIIDNGIGMRRDEVIAHVGTIAKSGTKEFLKAAKSQKAKDGSPDLIGQFGVGFYSAFMVADRVSLLTRRAGEAEATLWESTGDGSYTLTKAERAEAGTTVTLYLKPEDSEQGLSDFTQPWVLKQIVKRYSDFVAYPIKMLHEVKTPEPKADADETDAKADKEAAPKAPEPPKDETLNSMKAIWDRPKSEVTSEEYRDFYRHISHDWTDPRSTLPVKMEGNVEAYALLYIPTKAPPDLYSPEMKRGLQLYVKRVFVMDECKELMPTHLRFIKGVVDAHDLSLNVSREILQKDRQIQIIRKQLVKKIIGTLQEMKRDKPKDYFEFWSEFGPVLKEGLLGYDSSDKDKLLELVVAASTTQAKEPTSLEDYVGRMKKDQDAIYFLAGSSKEAIAQSPLLETFKDKGYEVLLFADPVDEIWLENAPKFKDKSLQSIGKGEVKLGSEDERKKASEALDEKKKTFGDLLECLQGALAEEIKEVRLSNRLTASAACLVADEHDMGPRMQQMLEQMGQKAEKPKRILELNPEHALVTGLQKIFAANKDDPRLKTYAQLVLGQAHLAESAQLPDPGEFSRALAEVMVSGIAA